MFSRDISILTGSAVDVGAIPAPRPWDALTDRCAQAALRSLQAPARFMPLSERLKEPERYAELQRARREQLEAFLWIEPNAAALEKMLDLISQICEEGAWSAGGAAFDDPAHPAIDLQAAETGMLLAWLLRRHGARLSECNPRIPTVLLGEVRRRLLGPILAHEDYPFMRLGGRRPAQVAADLLLSCLMLEKSPVRRQQPVKLLLRLLDEICAVPQSPRAPLLDRLADACAVADLARLLKRLTRGELDLTRSQPPESWLDGMLIPWITDDYFFDTAGDALRPPLPGIDLFRLGHLAQDRALCALGAQLHRACARDSDSLNGRVLSMEYMRAALDESARPPRLKRAATEGAALMVSRVDPLYAAIAGDGGRGNAGDVALFYENMPVLTVAGGEARSLPLIDGRAPLSRPAQPPAAEANFGDGRDLMSVDLTDTYPAQCGLSAYQRTLMVSRGDATVRLVDAFEFDRAPEQLCFRFVSVQRPLSLRSGVRLGPVLLRWDGEMLPEISELPARDGFPGGWLLCFTLRPAPSRLICGFSFEAAAPRA